ncbi:hypothetical protein BpHYR1_044861 [Brachionus plicatilis]|uniref:Uncharacterized protein n=1 Tax=Brachionus plicatilis TaxID=10195 RepID=A0A3M7R1I0_BRAPC|nr:hypothetical protein BpHYR1_044861 [Brachionus plicatilis]
MCDETDRKLSSLLKILFKYSSSESLMSLINLDELEFFRCNLTCVDSLKTIILETIGLGDVKCRKTNSSKKISDLEAVFPLIAKHSYLP